MFNNAYFTLTNPVANAPAFSKDIAGFFQQVALHNVFTGATFYGFRTGLDDIKLAIITIFRPLNIHWAAVVFLNDHCLTSERLHFVISNRKYSAQVTINALSLNRFTNRSLLVVNHLDGFSTKIATQNRWSTLSQVTLVNVELVRVYRTLHNGFAQAI